MRAGRFRGEQPLQKGAMGPSYAKLSQKHDSVD